MTQILLNILAIYGATTLIVNYDGPMDIFLRLREEYKVFRCIPCLCVWLSVPFLFTSGLVVYLAIIGGVIALDEALV